MEGVRETTESLDGRNQLNAFEADLQPDSSSDVLDPATLKPRRIATSSQLSTIRVCAPGLQAQRARLVMQRLRDEFEKKKYNVV